MTTRRVRRSPSHARRERLSRSTENDAVENEDSSERALFANLDEASGYDQEDMWGDETLDEVRDEWLVPVEMNSQRSGSGLVDEKKRDSSGFKSPVRRKPLPASEPRPRTSPNPQRRAMLMPTRISTKFSPVDPSDVVERLYQPRVNQSHGSYPPFYNPPREVRALQTTSASVRGNGIFPARITKPPLPMTGGAPPLSQPRHTDEVEEPSDTVIIRTVKSKNGRNISSLHANPFGGSSGCRQSGEALGVGDATRIRMRGRGLAVPHERIISPGGQRIGVSATDLPERSVSSQSLPARSSPNSNLTSEGQVSESVLNIDMETSPISQDVKPPAGASLPSRKPPPNCKPLGMPVVGMVDLQMDSKNYTNTSQRLPSSSFSQRGSKASPTHRHSRPSTGHFANASRPKAREHGEARPKTASALPKTSFATEWSPQKREPLANPARSSRGSRGIHAVIVTDATIAPRMISRAWRSQPILGSAR